MADLIGRSLGARLRWTITVAVALLAAVWTAQAQAATYTVGTTDDNTGTCVPTSGTCSLRQLIDYENSLASTPSPADTIVVPTGGYDLTNGALRITQSLSIVGGGASSTEVEQDSSTPDRVFDVLVPTNPTNDAQDGPPPTVTISGLSIEFGTANSSTSPGYFGGDVVNEGTLTLSEDTIARGTATAGSGGGISNDGGTLTVTHSLVSNNTSTYSSGGGDSGGIQNFGPNPFTGTAGVLEVDNSTIVDNTSALGGGIFSWCGGTDSACSSSGAGNTTTIVNSTIADNNVTNARGSTNGGGLLVSEGSSSVENSIVALNTVSTPASGTASDCGTNNPGTISSLGHNLESGTDCGFTSAGDLQGQNPEFTSTGPQDNGGDTETLGLDAASPAVDAVPAGASGCSGTDQRGISRPQGTECDIGAFELFQPTEGAAATIQVADATAQVNAGSVEINWGDGTSSAGSAPSGIGPIDGTHTYAEHGIYHGTVSWTDDAGAHNNIPFDVKVQDAPLTAAGVSLSSKAGAPFSDPVATFTDANPDGTASDFSATINWGDGTTSPGTVSGPGTFTVSGTHTYTAGGTYAVTVSIVDSGGATATVFDAAAVSAVPGLTSGAPTVTSTTAAAFTATVDPEGLATNVIFEYGPQLPDSTFAYSSTTPSQSAGSDFSSHKITATVTGLLPNTIYHVRAIATNSAGTTTGPDQTVKTPSDPPPPPPVLGKSFDVSVVSGLVLIKLPDGKPLYAGDPGPRLSPALTKGVGFEPLTEARRLPAGTQVDARLGTLKLDAASGAKHGKIQTGTFNGALFKLSQDARGLNKGLTTLSVLENAFPGAPSYSACKAKKAVDIAAPVAEDATLSSKILQTLHASAHGKFRTKGKYAAATVLGTAWRIGDRCNGTFIHVSRHSVLITDFVRHVTFLLHAGHSYLARAPSGKHK
jgi:hypothetical protein